MKIQESVVRKLSIEGANGLDQVSACFETLEANSGRFSVSCREKKWSSTLYGLREGESIEEFLQRCEAGFLARRLAPETSDPVFDPEALQAKCKRAVLRERRTHRVSSHVARNLFESIEGMELKDDPWNYAGLLGRILGEDWFRGLPKKPNPEYPFLIRIIEAVQAALRLREAGVSASAPEIDRLRGVVSTLAGALSSVSQSIEETAAVPDGAIRGDIFMREGQETVHGFIKRTLEMTKPKLKIVA